MIPREAPKFYKIGKAKAFFQPEGSPFGFDIGNLASFNANFEQEVQDYNTNEDGTGSPVFSDTTSTTATLTFEARNYNRIVQMLSYMSEKFRINQVAQPAESLTYTKLGVPEEGAIIELKVFKILAPKVSITTSGVAIALVENTHFRVDYRVGVIKLITLPEEFDEDTATGVEVKYGCEAYTANQYAGFSNGGGIRGALLLVDTNPKGPKFSHRFHIVEVRPDGDQNFVSDTDLTTRSFTGRIYQDATQPAGFEFFTVTELPETL